jgi:hypothetical protein
LRAGSARNRSSKQLDAVASGFLGNIHGRVRGIDDLLESGTIFRGCCEPDTDGDPCILSLEPDDVFFGPFPEFLSDPCATLPVCVTQTDDPLFSPETGDHVRLTDVMDHQVSQLL